MEVKALVLNRYIELFKIMLLYEGGQLVSNKTVRTYQEELALHKYVDIKKSVATKTLPRIAAEDSLCSVT
eukprot:2078185-Ditylum_brightwellii.AAC.1